MSDTSKNAMSITNFVALAKILPPWTSILLRADHGVGKSQVIAQVADYFRMEEFGGEGFPLIDIRLGQVTEGDILGLPSTDGNVTRFNPPDWVQRACDAPAMLFLDEINRATIEVMQAAFELVLDRRLQGRTLHPQTRVAAAVNTGASYTVNEMDPALLDRFWTIDLVPNVGEWLDWALKSPEMIDTIIDFIRQNQAMLDPPKDGGILGSVQASRRSWHRLSVALKHAGIEEDATNNMFFNMCRGFVGQEATIAFVDFAKNHDTRIDPVDVMTKLVTKVVSGQKIDDIDQIGKDNDPNVYNEVLVKKIERSAQDKLNGVIAKVAEWIHNECSKKGKGLSHKQGVTLAKFMSLLPDELRISMWTKLIETGIDDMKFSSSVHRYGAPAVMGCFGVPMGKAGVGVTPTIPGIFKDAAKKAS